MPLAFTLLLNAAAASLDQLWLLRAERDVGVLTPEYLDPGLHHRIEGPPCAQETALRHRLCQIGAQLRAGGVEAALRAVLQAALPTRRQAALLALVGGGTWRPGALLPGGVDIQTRQAGDGGVYLLATHPDQGAQHAPHAIRDHVQRLWLLPPGHAAADGATLPESLPDLQLDRGPDSLSIEAALRDLILALPASRAASLARELRLPMPATALPARRAA